MLALVSVDKPTPESERLAPRASRVVLYGAAVVVITAGLKAAGDFLVPLVFSIFVAVLVSPAVFWLESKRLPRVLAIAIVASLVVAAMMGVGIFVGRSLRGFSHELPRYQEGVLELANGGRALAEHFGLPIETIAWEDIVSPGAAVDVATLLVSELGAFLSNALLVVLSVVFLLLEATALPVKLRAAFGDRTGALDQARSIANEIKSYIVIKTYVSLATGVVVALAMWWLDIDFPLLWGFAAFFLNYVPNVGSVLAAIPPALLGLVDHGLGKLVWVSIVFLLVNVVIGNIIEPKMMGRRLGLSTFVVFFSLVFWGWLWGPAGMLLSVPLTMVVKIVLENTTHGHAIAVLMGELREAAAHAPPEADAPDEPADA